MFTIVYTKHSMVPRRGGLVCQEAAILLHTLNSKSVVASPTLAKCLGVLALPFRNIEPNPKTMKLPILHHRSRLLQGTMLSSIPLKFKPSAKPAVEALTRNSRVTQSIDV